MTAQRPDLNVDLGELPNEPVELYEIAHRVNIACGGHAGDEASMSLACERAQRAGTLIGAHPSYDDKEGFGRRVLTVGTEELRTSLERQCRALREIAAQHGLRVSHVKLHGALYHEANHKPEFAQLTAEVVRTLFNAIPLVGPPEGALREAATQAGLPYMPEGFADRRYLPDGKLAPRSQPDALVTVPALAAEQARSLARSGRFQTVCVHSDTPSAVAIARAVRQALDAL